MRFYFFFDELKKLLLIQPVAGVCFLVRSWILLAVPIVRDCAGENRVLMSVCLVCITGECLFRGFVYSTGGCLLFSMP